jgi:hypothetical protein
MQWFIFFLTILVSSANLLDFLIGAQGNKRLRAALFSFYMATEAGDWQTLYRVPAQIMLKYMGKVFGGKLISVRYVASVWLVSASIYTVLFTALAVFSVGSLYFQHRENSLCESFVTEQTTNETVWQYLNTILFFYKMGWTTIAQNFFLDLASWATSVILFRVIISARGKIAVSVVGLSPAVILAMILGSLISYFPLARISTALTHTEHASSLAMMAAGVAVQTKGLGSALCSAR